MGEESEKRETTGEAPGKPAVPGVDIPVKAMEKPENVAKLLSSVAEMVERLAEIVERLMDEIVESLEGGKVGDDVAKFYSKLKESGLPEEVAVEMTREYFRKRISVAEEIVKAVKEAM